MSVAPKWRAVLHATSKNCRQRGSDETDSPLLLEPEDAAEDGDVVIGGEQGNQAEGDADEHLEHTHPFLLCRRDCAVLLHWLESKRLKLILIEGFVLYIFLG